MLIPNSGYGATGGGFGCERVCATIFSVENQSVSEQKLQWQKRNSAIVSKWLPWVVIVLLAGVTAILWQPIAVLLSGGSEAQLAASIQPLGGWAPVAFFALSIVQIIGAPIPGYPIQFLGGALFGRMWGGVYGVLGVVAGGVLAAWLARQLGRPFIERHVEPDQLAKYERLAKLEKVWMWVIILLLPVGDFPYFVAGLSRVPLRTLALATLLSRGPFTFLVAWVGASSIQAPPWVFIALIVAVLALVALGYIFRVPLTDFFDRHVIHRLE